MIEQAAQAWADEMTRQAVENAKRKGEDYYQQKMKEYPNCIDEHHARCKAQAIDTIQGIIDRSEELCKQVSYGKFHPSNKFSRKLFTAATSLCLPPTVGGTDKIVREWFGDSLVAFENAKHAEIEAKEQADKRERQEREINRKAATVKNWVQGVSISGEDFLELARDIGIDVHPRTAGTIRNRVYSVSKNGARIQGKRLPDGVWDVIRQASERFKRETVEV